MKGVEKHGTEQLRIVSATVEKTGGQATHRFIPENAECFPGTKILQ